MTAIVKDGLPQYTIMIYGDQNDNVSPCISACIHYTIFSVVKLDLYIRALLLDHILARKKTTRTPRVHLVKQYRQEKVSHQILYINNIENKRVDYLVFLELQLSHTKCSNIEQFGRFT